MPEGEIRHYLLCNSNKYEVDYGTFAEVQFEVGHNWVDSVKDSEGKYKEIILSVDESVLNKFKIEKR